MDNKKDIPPYEPDKPKEIEDAKNDLEGLDLLGLNRFSKYALKAIEKLPGYEFLIHDEKERIEKAKRKPGARPALTVSEQKETARLYEEYQKQHPSRRKYEIIQMLIDHWNDKKGKPGESFKLNPKTIRNYLKKS